MNQSEMLDIEPKRYWEGENLEQYVISVCLHDKRALAKAISNLNSQRDFKNVAHAKAFGVIEARYDAREDVDSLVVIDEWIDLGIFPKGEARLIAGAYEGDTDYEPKINELKTLGGMRKARRDTTKLYEFSSKEGTTPEKMANKAFDMAVSWNSGTHKKYYTAREVYERQKNQKVGENLRLGIPLFDEQIYQYSGLHRGTMKATIFREKHGKTRVTCWEIAQHLLQGRKVLYVTLEGKDTKINGNMLELLKDRWDGLADNLFIKDSTVLLGEIKSAIIEASFADSVDVVVVDYLQRMELDTDRWIGENQKFNQCCKELTDLCVKYDFLLNLLSQATKQEKQKTGYGNVPDVYDAYGSKQIIKDASMIMIGFRPKWYEELIEPDRITDKLYVKDPNEQTAPYNSVFMKPVLSREKLECAHRYAHFVDTDHGLKLHKQELI